MSTKLKSVLWTSVKVNHSSWVSSKELFGRYLFLFVASWPYEHKHGMHISCLFTSFPAQPGIGTGGSDGQRGCSSHGGFVVLGGVTVSNLRPVRSGHVSSTPSSSMLWTGNFRKPLRSMRFDFLWLLWAMFAPQDPALESSVAPYRQCLWVSASCTYFWPIGLSGARCTSWSSL